MFFFRATTLRRVHVPNALPVRVWVGRGGMPALWVQGSLQRRPLSGEYAVPVEGSAVRQGTLSTCANL